MSERDELRDEKISQLYQQLPELEPSEKTDALILAAARRELGSRLWRLTPGWSATLATAASLVLISITVLWMARGQHGENAPSTTASTPVSVPEAAVPPAGVEENRQAATVAGNTPAQRQVARSTAREERGSKLKVPAGKHDSDALASQAGVSPSPATPAPVLGEAPTRAEPPAAKPAVAAKTEAFLAGAPAAKLQLYRDYAAAPAVAAPPSLPDWQQSYRQAMAAANFAQAWQTLTANDAAGGDSWTTLDRDLLTLLLNEGDSKPGCLQNAVKNDALAVDACQALEGYWRSGQGAGAGLKKLLDELLAHPERAYWQPGLQELMQRPGKTVEGSSHQP